MIINVDNTDYIRCTEAVRKRIGDDEKFAFVMTFGCQQNEADSEKIRGMLCDMGYKLCEFYRDADVIIVNTCAIREHAEMKALSMLGNFREVKRRKPDLMVGVVGCMAAEPGVCKKLKTDFHYVTFTLEPNMLHRLSSVILRYLEDSRRSFIIGEDSGDVYEGLPTVRKSGSKAWVSIMYGCNNFCSYCIVPYVRGRERSRESALIIEECRELVSSGIKEITLLGQNVNSYCSDMNFAELLRNIAELQGDFIIRFMTSHPKDVSSELIEVMGKYTGKVAPYFHLPLQSGSDPILKAMNRTYSSEAFIDVAKRLRAAVPNIALSTDVIIGFPGETDEDFEKTLSVLEAVRFDVVYSFLYSAREGTRAAGFTNTVDDGVKGERMKRLLVMQDGISLEKNLPYVSRSERVLVEGREEKNGVFIYTARTGSNKLVHFPSEKVLDDTFYDVEIKRAGPFDLFAELK